VRAKVVSLFRYLPLDPETVRLALRPRLVALGVTGRIVLAPEGVNLQAAVRGDRMEGLKAALHEVGVSFPPEALNVDAEERDDVEDAFGKLRIRVRTTLVAEAREAQSLVPTPRSLPPRAFHSRLQALDGEAGVVLDARNLYESEVGRFSPARALDCSTHAEAAEAMRRALQDVPKSAPVLMYCTGGIRCEKLAELATTWGFTDVSGLRGGIVAYAREIPPSESLFRGVNVVFDRRRTVAVTEDALGQCISCGERTSRLSNCSNKACAAILVQCTLCGEAMRGTCSPACAAATALPAAWVHRLVRVPLVRGAVQTSHESRSIRRRAFFPQWAHLPPSERRENLRLAAELAAARARARPEVGFFLALCHAHLHGCKKGPSQEQQHPTFQVPSAHPAQPAQTL
jgi:UPF0176 protein